MISVHEPMFQQQQQFPLAGSCSSRHNEKHVARCLRYCVSQPTLDAHDVSKRKFFLSQRPSRLDLIDQKLTFFPHVDELEHTRLEIVDDYFPDHVYAKQQVEERPRVSDTDWTMRLYKKLRWRWRLAGLVHH